jgi:hypothetical protein
LKYMNLRSIVDRFMSDRVTPQKGKIKPASNLKLKLDFSCMMASDGLSTGLQGLWR